MVDVVAVELKVPLAEMDMDENEVVKAGGEVMEPLLDCDEGVGEGGTGRFWVVSVVGVEEGATCAIAIVRVWCVVRVCMERRCCCCYGEGERERERGRDD